MTTDEIARRYASGEPLRALHKASGLSVAKVRKAVLKHGGAMRSCGRVTGSKVGYYSTRAKRMAARLAAAKRASHA